MSTPVSFGAPGPPAVPGNLPAEVVRTYPGFPPDAYPNIDHLITEDDKPVDSIYSAKQAELLCATLSASFPRPHIASSDVGLFQTPKDIAVAPDFFLSLDVQVKGEPLPKRNRSYFFWEYRKAPEVSMEIVSDTDGNEEGTKKSRYAELGIPYYVIWDAANILGEGLLRIFVLRGPEYVPLDGTFLPLVGLGLRMWHGPIDGWDCIWLRWTDKDGNLLLTGAEQRHSAEKEKILADQERLRADKEQQRADEERQRAYEERQRAEKEKAHADQERQRAEQERLRAEKLAEKLRAMGIDPES